MRVLLDTNILLAIVPKRSKHRWAYDALRADRYELVVSNEILDEYEEQLGLFYAPNFAILVIEEMLNLNNIVFTNIYFNWNLITIDADNNKWVDAAVSGNADYIVTHDKHFSVLKTINFPKISVINLEDFRLLLDSPFYTV